MRRREYKWPTHLPAWRAVQLQWIFLHGSHSAHRGIYNGWDDFNIIRVGCRVRMHNPVIIYPRKNYLRGTCFCDTSIYLIIIVESCRASWMRSSLAIARGQRRQPPSEPARCASWNNLYWWACKQFWLAVSQVPVTIIYTVNMRWQSKQKVHLGPYNNTWCHILCRGKGRNNYTAIFGLHSYRIYRHVSNWWSALPFTVCWRSGDTVHRMTF